MIHYYFGTFDDCFLVLKMLSTLHSPFVCFLPSFPSPPTRSSAMNVLYHSYFRTVFVEFNPSHHHPTYRHHHFMNPMLCRPFFFLFASFVLVFYVCCLVCILSSSLSLLFGFRPSLLFPSSDTLIELCSPYFFFIK